MIQGCVLQQLAEKSHLRWTRLGRAKEKSPSGSCSKESSCLLLGRSGQVGNDPSSNTGNLPYLPPERENTDFVLFQTLNQ